MKKLKITFWIVTGLFSAFMIFSAIPNIMQTQESVEFMTNLGYPEYFGVFIGVAKLIGVIAILIPGFSRIKEWAYAGLFFDLFGAFYSLIAKDGFQPQTLFMLVFIAMLFLSYFLFHKLETLKKLEV